MTPIPDSNGTSATPNGATNGTLNGHLNGTLSASTPTGSTPKVPSHTPTPIAIIGLSLRAGPATDPHSFFTLLSRMRSTFSPTIPTTRFNPAPFFHPSASKLGCTNTNAGSFVSGDITSFDAPFFSISEQEAISMDPQQRMLLECAFEALDSAGVPKGKVVGSGVGVFVGAAQPEYEVDLWRDGEGRMFQATGNHLAMQANRISHFFDWRGPSVTMDTACSSSLTAVHYACQSIRNGESEIALVGGCNLNLIPEFFMNYSTSRLLGNAGRSYSFDARGTGYGRGEGCGMILLKPLDQAIRDNDSVRAVIFGSGVNQDGYTPGITTPNGSSQEALIRSIYTSYDLDPNLTGYVEAHGTGTRVGDPIEVGALHNVFGTRPARDPLYVGSVKSNIGHLESASGILAVIKTALILDRGFILPNYDFQKANPNIPFKEWGMKIPVRQIPWPRNKKYASVNNFGFGGTNAHVVMGRAPLQTTIDLGINVGAKDDPTKKLFVLSAADKSTCQKMMANLGVYLEQRPEMFQRDLMANVAYTIGQRRSALSWRVAIPATESFDLVEKLSKGTINPIKETGIPRIGFVCTGQGAQWWAMGRELYGRYPLFAETINKASAILTKLGAPYSLIDELDLDEHTTRVNQAHISQPACTAIQLALIDLLRSWGIIPTAVVGHSSGEIAAAYAAGILSAESAMRIAYHRGRLIPVLKERFPQLQGTMMAVGCGKEDIDPIIQKLSEREARIACYNSPQSLTISGDTPAIEELQHVLEEKKIFQRKLVIETAYHSHHMELIADDYYDSIQDVSSPGQSQVRFFSSLMGKQVLHSALDSSYWVRNLTSPVKFAQALQHLVAPAGDFATGVDLLLEVGPHSALQGPIKQTLKTIGGAVEKIPYVGTLARKKDAVDTMLDLASTLFCKGAPIDLERVNFPKITKMPSLLVDLPTYPWNHSKVYWHESRISHMHKNRPFPRHDILGVLANYSNDLEPTWRNFIRLDDIPWLRHHKIQDMNIFPISGFAGMAIEAISQQSQMKEIDVAQIELRDLVVHTPLMIPDDEVEMTITLRPLKTAETAERHMTSNFLIHSYSASGGWTENCTGIATVRSNEVNEVDGQAQLEQKAAEMTENMGRINKAPQSVPQTRIYSALSGLNIVYGSTFQGLSDCRADDQHAVANITVTDTASDMPEHYETSYILHPSFLEQLVQMYWPILGAGRTALDVVCLPSSIGRLTVSTKVRQYASAPEHSLRAYCSASKPLSTDKPSKISMFAVAEDERIIAIDDLTIAPLPTSGDDGYEHCARELCYKQIWEPILEPLTEIQDLRVDSPQDDPLSNGSALPATPISIIHGTSQPQLELARMLAASVENVQNTKVDLCLLEELDSSDKHCICITELDQPLLSTLDATQLQALQSIVRKSQGLLWVTQGAYGQKGDPTANMVTGFSRAIRSETMFKFATLDLDAEEKLDDTSSIQAILKVFKMTMSASTIANTEMEFQERKGEFWTPRIVSDDKANDYVHRKIFPPAVEETKFSDGARSLKMAISTPGNLDTLYFVDDDCIREPLATDEIEILVKAVPVSARDVYTATGQLDDSVFGQECSGIVSRLGENVNGFAVGDRVAAIANSAFATYARAKSDLTLKLNRETSFEEAASLPLASCSAQYGLVDLARLEDEENLLILNGAGAFGQAAISLAQAIGADVFATVETADEKRLLVEGHGLSERQIFYHKGFSFSESILQSIDQRGVDVIYSAHVDPVCIEEAAKCIAEFGRVVCEHTSDGSNTAKNMLPCLGGNTGVFSFDFSSLAKRKPKLVRRLFKDVSRCLRYGKLRPIYSPEMLRISQVSQAFKLVRASSSRSRTVVVPHADDVVKTTPSKNVARMFKQDATYILIGGTGGLGRGMARWMASKGAKHIVLISRSGSATGPVKILVDDLAQIDVHVAVHSCNVARKEDVDALLQTKLTGLPPIRGVIHGAMILKDKLFDNMEVSDWTQVIESKVQGAWNFHHALKSTALDFFIVYSSSAAAIGGRGQTAYAAANSFLDAFAQYRRSLGLPGASLGPTAVSDAGFLFENADMWSDVQRNIGESYITEAEVLSLLEATLDGTAQASCNNHIITGVDISPLNPQFWATDAKYKHLRLEAEATAALLNNGARSVSWNAALRAAESRSDAEKIVCDGLVEKIAKTVGLELEEIDPTRNLSSYALDSLTAIDVRNFISREFESTMQVLELLASGTIQTLAKAVCAKSKLLSPAS
ncbi:lovastatin nonaketide synthase [Corynespora cassiicola Philippines]|uniref:Lovastatin nonaketide synthase n=1 Tax=Corynespora cassiicola Philippines TaxID=1448308 RepID=A0A2T2NQQ0_CORCC|nr:lovastatin nonaketide synthase [Corynespora cassiicola Philippines]